MYYPEFNHENHTENANLGTLQITYNYFKSVTVTKGKNSKLTDYRKVQKHDNQMQCGTSLTEKDINGKTE